MNAPSPIMPNIRQPVSKSKSFVLWFQSIAVFLISLQSYYIYSVGASVFPVIGAVLLILLGIKNNGPRLGVPVMVLFFCAYFSFVVAIDVFRNQHISTLVAFPFLVATILGTVWSFHHRLDNLASVLAIVLYIHLGFYIIQVVTWLLAGHYIDFLYPITGESQRMFSPKGLHIGFRRIPRFCGLYNEPGTFSVYIITLSALKYVVDRKVDLLLGLALLAVLLSLSLFGFTLVVLFGTVLAFGSFGARYVAGASVIGYFVLVLVLPAIERRLASGYSGVDGREEAINFTLEWSNFLLGASSLEQIGILTNDSGIFISSLIHGGVVELTLLFLVLLTSTSWQSVISIGVVCLVLVTKIKLTYPMFWLFVAAIYLASHRPRECAARCE